MMDSKSALVAERMVGLRQYYLQHLDGRIAALELFLQQCHQTPTPEQLESARLHAHSLAGSGSIYGFTEISRYGRALEAQIIEGGERYIYKLSDLTGKLVAACKEARKQQMAGKSPALAHPTQASGAQPPILVIDDDTAITVLIQQLLGDSVAVSIAHDGQEALALLKGATAPALIIVDELMPNMSGFPFLEHIRAVDQWRDIPVLMLTASHDSFNIQQASRYGVADFLPKPFEPEKLIEHVRAIFKF